MQNETVMLEEADWLRDFRTSILTSWLCKRMKDMLGLLCVVIVSRTGAG